MKPSSLFGIIAPQQLVTPPRFETKNLPKLPLYVHMFMYVSSHNSQTVPYSKNPANVHSSCIYNMNIYIYMVPPPKTHTFSEFTGICAILLLFTMFKCLFFLGRLFYIFKKLCRVVKTLPPLIKLFSFNRKGFLQNLEKTKKTKLFGEVLVSGQKIVFFGFP